MKTRCGLALLLVLGCGSPAGPTEHRPEAPAEAEPVESTITVTEPMREPGNESPEVAVEEEPQPIDPVAEILALEPSASTSVGGPQDGSLEGGVAIPLEAPGFRNNTNRPNPGAHFGTVELVQSLLLAARSVDASHPGGELVVNDIGFETGGAIPHHGSHRAGRDVDVLFYLLDREGEPMPSVGAFLDPRGRGYDFRDLAVPDDDVLVRLDAPRTWAFVRALLEGPFGDQVQRIFVAEHVRTLLVTEAERSRAPAAVRARFGEITCQPGYPHDDHLHIRFFCTPEDMAAGCEDSGPTYGWRRAALRALDLRPVINRPRRDRPRAPTVSAEEARAAAGPMHARVEQWLARREAWMEPPHPGRPFCR